MQMKFTTNTRETKMSSSQNLASNDKLTEEDIQSIMPFQKYLNMVPDKSPKKVSMSSSIFKSFCQSNKI